MKPIIAKLTDFGASKQTDKDEDVLVDFLSPLYAPPEQYGRNIKNAADIYRYAFLG